MFCVLRLRPASFILRVQFPFTLNVAFCHRAFSARNFFGDVAHVRTSSTTMFEEEGLYFVTILLMAAALLLKRQTRKRRRELVSSVVEKGRHYHSLNQEMRICDTKRHIGYLRMSPDIYQDLLQRVKDKISLPESYHTARDDRPEIG